MVMPCLSDPEYGMTDAKGYAVRFRRIRHEHRDTRHTKLRKLQYIRNRDYGSRYYGMVDSNGRHRPMGIGDPADLDLVMAATIVVHAAIVTFLCGIMTQRNVRQIAHAVMGAHHHPC